MHAAAGCCVLDQRLDIETRFIANAAGVVANGLEAGAAFTQQAGGVRSDVSESDERQRQIAQVQIEFAGKEVSLRDPAIRRRAGLDR